MDSTITARFFRVSEKPRQCDDFHEILLAVAAETDAESRERPVTTANGAEVIFRLETCAQDGQFVAGDFCRIQTENIPPGASKEGLAAIELPAGSGLGHLAAFRYHIPTRVILFQSNNQCGSLNRVASYFARLNPAALFVFKPVFRQDALERVLRKEFRQIEIGFSSPANLDALDEAGVPAAKGAKMLAEAYDGLSVTVTIGVSKKRKKFLNTNVVMDTINRVLGSSADYSRVKAVTSDDGDTEPVNFLTEVLRCDEILKLPEGDPEAHYEIRKNYLLARFNDNMPYLTAHYGPKSDGNGS